MPKQPVFDHDFICDLYQQGTSQATIARTVGCTRQNVGLVLRKRGLLPAPEGELFRTRVRLVTVTIQLADGITHSVSRRGPVDTESLQQLLRAAGQE